VYKRQVVDRYGADTLRFYLLSSPIIKGEDLNFIEQHVAELSRKNIGRLENVLTFYELYKDSVAHDATIEDSPNVLDKWIHSRLHELIGEITDGYEAYELDKATKPITDFIDDLSTWYTRRARDRFKGTDMTDRGHALSAMRYVLRKLAKVIAPSMPFYAEHLFLRVRTDKDPESVHLSDWPTPGSVDLELIATMSYVRSYATKGLMLRTQKNIKVRQPLAVFTITHVGVAPKYWDECVTLLKDELNVEVVLLEIIEEGEPSAEFDWVITDNLKRKGEVRDFIRSVQELRKVSEFTPNDRIVLRVATDEYGQALLIEFKTLISETVQANDIVFETTATGTPIALTNVGFSVHLDKVA
jgi:isoleucyl-tRNA synthetase